MRTSRHRLWGTSAVAAALLLLCALATSPALGDGTIEEYHADTITPYNGTTAKPPPKRSTTAKLSYFFGTWGTWVPGATYDTADYRWFSSGARGKAVQIGSNGKWAWHGRHGHWRRTSDRDYPLVLVHALDGHNWKVGTASGAYGCKGAGIVLWDGYSWYCGKRAKKR